MWYNVCWDMSATADYWVSRYCSRLYTLIRKQPGWIVLTRPWSCFVITSHLDLFLLQTIESQKLKVNMILQTVISFTSESVGTSTLQTGGPPCKLWSLTSTQIYSALQPISSPSIFEYSPHMKKSHKTWNCCRNSFLLDHFWILSATWENINL